MAKEIDALESEPLLVVQTSPPDGTVIPAGPRHIIIRGIAWPGATVKVNGYAAEVAKSGYFSAYSFLGDNQSTITVTARDGKSERTVVRKFLPTD